MEMEMEFLRKLPTPQELKEQHPVSAQIVATKAKRDDEIRDIFEGKSDKLILVIGPCSADNEDAVIDYISRLRTVQEKVSDKIFMIPRIYTNKPRTTGIGYKGMLHQPDPERESDMLKGIIAIRHMPYAGGGRDRLYLRGRDALPGESPLSFGSSVVCGDRGALGRKSAAQADGERCGNSGRNEESDRRRYFRHDEFDHCGTARTYVLYRGWEVKTTGNPYAHAILRGYVDKFGRNIPNYLMRMLQNFWNL